MIGNSVVPTTRTDLPSTSTSSPIATPGVAQRLGAERDFVGCAGGRPLTTTKPRVARQELLGETRHLVAVDVRQVVDPDAGDRGDVGIGPRSASGPRPRRPAVNASFGPKPLTIASQP